MIRILDWLIGDFSLRTLLVSLAMASVAFAAAAWFTRDLGPSIIAAVIAFVVIETIAFALATRSSRMGVHEIEGPSD